VKILFFVLLIILTVPYLSGQESKKEDTICSRLNSKITALSDSIKQLEDSISTLRLLLYDACKLTGRAEKKMWHITKKWTKKVYWPLIHSYHVLFVSLKVVCTVDANGNICRYNFKSTAADTSCNFVYLSPDQENTFFEYFRKRKYPNIFKGKTFIFSIGHLLPC